MPATYREMMLKGGRHGDAAVGCEMPLLQLAVYLCEDGKKDFICQRGRDFCRKVYLIYMGEVHLSWMDLKTGVTSGL